MSKVILAYVPVLHEGYRQFFSRHGDARVIYVWGEALIREHDHLRKDVRALPPLAIVNALWAWVACRHIQFDDSGSCPIRIAHPALLERLGDDGAAVVMPDDDEHRALAAKYLAGVAVEFDRSVFLRWDRSTVLAEEAVRSERVVPFEGFVAEMMQHAYAEVERATNLWRRVGAVIARGGQVLLAAANVQVPSAHTPYYEGDPRMFFKRGLHFELTTDEHAEARLIAEAAADGIPLRGADLFVTTFPCPPCAKLVARAGLARLYFATGYAKLDGERILRERGIEIIQVEMKSPDA